MKRIKRVLGVILILSAICSLVFWEMKGRDIILKDEVVIATQEILPGSVITSENVGIMGVLESNLVNGAVSPSAFEMLVGRAATSYIPRNAQVTKLMVEEDSDLIIEEGESLYTLDGEWLAMRSSSLRRGDQITVYGENSKLPVGTFQVAFVKDSSGREVKNTGSLYYDTPLNREESTSIIDKVEIICDLDSYGRILDVLEKEPAGKLLIVQEGER